MKPRYSFGFFFLLALFLLGGGALLLRQWRESMALRVERERAMLGAHELARLRDENRRLREKQISAAELERLRADHAALPRLRAEVEALKAK
jgi:hypothetical protein